MLKWSLRERRRRGCRQKQRKSNSRANSLLKMSLCSRRSMSNGKKKLLDYASSLLITKRGRKIRSIGTKQTKWRGWWVVVGRRSIWENKQEKTEKHSQKKLKVRSRCQEENTLYRDEASSSNEQLIWRKESPREAIMATAIKTCFRRVRRSPRRTWEFFWVWMAILMTGCVRDTV